MITFLVFAQTPVVFMMQHSLVTEPIITGELSCYTCLLGRQFLISVAMGGGLQCIAGPLGATFLSVNTGGLQAPRDFTDYLALLSSFVKPIVLRYALRVCAFHLAIASACVYAQQRTVEEKVLPILNVSPEIYDELVGKAETEKRPSGWVYSASETVRNFWRKLTKQ